MLVLLKSIVATLIIYGIGSLIAFLTIDRKAHAGWSPSGVLGITAILATLVAAITLAWLLDLITPQAM